jgi:hypothetical protein
MGALLVVAASAGLAVAGDPSTLPDWMAGCWVAETEVEWVEECWTPPRGGIMLGTNRTGKQGDGDTPAGWEMMQIGPVRPEAEPAARGLAFRASLRGSPWTAFERVANKAPGLTFLNTAHDYPQRIHYWREGELLKAEVSLADGSEPMKWTFRKAAK